MRVIGGTAGGRRLATPRGLAIRPTSDRVKEALFSILQGVAEPFETCMVLDVFAGTGNLGIEALSRGAKGAVFVDSSRNATAIIVKNLELTGFTDKAEIIGKDYRSAFAALEATGRMFNLIFLDPPYKRELLVNCLEHLAASSLVERGAVVVAEHAARTEIDPAYGPLHQCDKRVYGDTALTFFTSSPKGMP